MIQIKRPLVTILIGVIIGIIYGLYLKLSIAITIIFLGLFLYLIQKNRRKIIYFLIKRKRTILIFLISLIISNLYFNFKNNQYKKVYEEFPEKIKGYAIVVSEPKETEYYYSYNVKIKNKKFILYVKKGHIDKLEYGMGINLEAEYYEPEENKNFEGFNYKEYLKTQEIYGTLKAESIQIKKEKDINLIFLISNKIRNKIIETAKNIVPKSTSGILTGLLIGDRSEISQEDDENFRKSSLSHILAISGSHIAYIILGITFILTKSRVPRKWIHISAIMALIIFMFITNFSPTIARACIMGIIMLFAKIVYKKLDILTSISLSYLIILLENPFSIKDLGVQLSYLGTLGIVYLNQPISKFLSKYINKKIAEILSVTISAQIMVLPIITINFNNISTLFIISNLLAVPLSGIIILLGYSNIFLGMVWLKLGQVLGVLTNLLIQILIWIAKIIANIPYSNFYVATPNKIIIFAYYIFVINVCRKKYIKQSIIVTIVLIILSIIPNFIPQNFKINFIDVGQRGLYTNKNKNKEKYISRYWRNRKCITRIFIR